MSLIQRCPLFILSEVPLYTNHHCGNTAVSSFLGEEDDICVTNFLYLYHIAVARLLRGGKNLGGREGGREGICLKSRSLGQCPIY